MDWRELWAEILHRLQDSLAAHPASASPWLALSIIVAAVIVSVPPLWLLLRPIVTIVHELGHAVIGILCGRRFTGFVINPDMSGHTVTAGKSSGIGLALTTLAGYPAPALVGAGIIAAAMAGFAPLVLLATMALTLIALTRAHTLYTAVTLLVLLGTTGYGWWSTNAEVSATAVSSAGLVLLIGAWRQFMSVVLHGSRRDDPGVLASVTAPSASVWKLVMLGLIALPTWWAVDTLRPAIENAI